MKITTAKLQGVVLIEPRVFTDERGFFMESWNKTRYADAGINGNFVQDNLSSSSKGVLRGLHYQKPNGQAKLVSVVEGEVFDVAVDIRLGSPTFGKWEGVILSSDNHRQLFVPDGFAHGFCVLSDRAIFLYKCTDFYNAQAEKTILWNDPQIGIDWSVENPTLSKKDLDAPTLSSINESELPVYSG